MKNLRLIVIALAVVIIGVNIISCSKNDDEPIPNSEEKEVVAKKIKLTHFKRLKDFVEDEADTITRLTIHGIVQGNDIDYILRMLQYGELTCIDMSDTQLVSSGDSSFVRIDGNRDELWEKNKINPYMFSNANKLREIRLPDTAERIGFYAFKNCVNLKSITIGKSTSYIAYDFITNCPQIEDIYMSPTTPPKTAEGKVPEKKCNLHVPKGAYNTYSTADFWKEFNIKEMK